MVAELTAANASVRGLVLFHPSKELEELESILEEELESILEEELEELDDVELVDVLKLLSDVGLLELLEDIELLDTS